MILIDRYVKFLIDNQLTERQFLGLYLSYTKRNDLIENYDGNINFKIYEHFCFSFLFS